MRGLQCRLEKGTTAELGGVVELVRGGWWLPAGEEEGEQKHAREKERRKEKEKKRKIGKILKRLEIISGLEKGAEGSKMGFWA